MTFLSRPSLPSSAVVDRIFSNVGLFMSKLGNRTKPETLKNRVFTDTVHKSIKTSEKFKVSDLLETDGD